MKSFLSFLFSVVFCYCASAQCATPVVTPSGPTTFCSGGSVTLSAPTGNTWTKKADFGGTARYSAVGMAIGSKGYVGLGAAAGVGFFKDFWEYDPVTDAWTQKANFPGLGRYYPVGFSIGNKGYVGTGWNGGASHYNDFWQYDPAANTWTQKANFGGTGRSGAVGFAIGSYGYVGTGNGGSNKNDFWQYNPATDTWTQKANFGGTGRSLAVGFSIGSYGYVGTGNDGSNKNDFWQYNPGTDTWTQKANFGGTGRIYAAGFSIGSYGYVGTGNDGSNKNDFWQYNSSSDTWSQKVSFGGPGRSSASAFSINGKGYIGTGNAFPSGYTKDLWEYTPDYTYSWSPGGQTTSSINATAQGNYYVAVTNAAGCTATSTPLTVTVTPGTKITTQPQASSVCRGNNAALSVTATGSNLTYKWYKNGQSASSNNTATLTINNVQASDAGQYTVDVIGDCGTVTSSAATLTVNTAPSITTQPVNATVCQGSDANFSIAVGGTPAPAVGWQYSTDAGLSWININTVSATSVSIPPAAMSGVYKVRAQVVNACGGVNSDVVSLTVNSAPSITTQPAGSTVCSGQSFSLGVAATGTGLSYQWKKNGVNINNAMGDNIIITSVSAANAGDYTVVISGSCGLPVISNVATLVVNSAPVITVPTNVTTSGEVNGCGASFSTLGSATGTPAPSITYKIGQTPITLPYTFPLGTTNVTVVAANSCGNDSKTVTITVEDKTAPSFTAPAARNVSLGINCSITVPDLTTGLSGSDNCGAVTFSQNPVAGTVIALGHNQTQVVTVTANDGHGNTTDHDVTLTAKDVTPPTITPPATAVVPTDAGKCSRSSVALGAPSYSDKCSGVTIANDAPAIYPKGTTLVTWTVTDAAGNQATATQSVTVFDNEAPMAPNLPTVTAECSATVTPINGTDNCAGTVVPTTKDALSYSAQGTYTIRWTYSNGAGNSTVKEQTVVIKDVTKPVADVATLPDITVECSATVISKPTAVDNCSGKVTATTADPLSYNTQGNYTIHWIYDDGNGNTSTQAQSVIVKDVTKPVPDAATLPEINGECSVSITNKPTATDNCTGTITAATTDPLYYNAQGSYVIHWSYSDGNGNSSTQEQTVIVKDATKPVPDVASLPDITAECLATIVNKPTATDNCAGKITATTTNAISYAVQGTYTITWTYNDGAGNTSTQTQTVIVKDVNKPLITAPAALTVSTDAGKCSASGLSLGTPVTSDNCTVASVSNNAPAVFSKGVTTVTWTVTDVAGNQTTATQTITVNDNEKPVVTCPVARATLCYSSSGTYTIAPLQAGDNCGIATITYSITGATTRSGSGTNASGTFNPGNSIITWTAMDAGGNTATCQTSVFVNSLLTVSIPDAKVLSSGVDANTVYIGYAPAGTITLSASVGGGSGSYSYKWSTGATTASIKVSPTTATTYTVTITDGKGCTGTVSKQVSMTDVRCGNKLDKVSVCHGGNTLCIEKASVPDHLGHGDYLGACGAAAATTKVAPAAALELVEETKLDLTASPNPSTAYFRLQIKGKPGERVVLTITDALGRVVENRSVNTGTVQAGDNYRPGIYIATATQGHSRSSVKLIRQ